VPVLACRAFVSSSCYLLQMPSSLQLTGWEYQKRWSCLFSLAAVPLYACYHSTAYKKFQRAKVCSNEQKKIPTSKSFLLRFQNAWIRRDEECYTLLQSWDGEGAGSQALSLLSVLWPRFKIKIRT
jgi:hypothetical protein